MAEDSEDRDRRWLRAAFPPTATRSDQLLFLTDEQLRYGIELMFFAYRGFTSDPDRILDDLQYGRAHHRAIHFVNRRPGLTVNELIEILGVTKQSLNRVLRQLVEDGLVESRVGTSDRRQRNLYLTEKGRALEQELSAAQRRRMRAAFTVAGPEAVAGFRKVLEQMIDPALREQVHRRGWRRPVTGEPQAHVLVVDDDQRIRELIRKFLARNGFWVTPARDAAQARRLLEGLEFDLLVLDVMMPGEDGLALTASLRETLTTPILLLTARGDADDRIRGFEAGADDYLPKPFEPRELLLRIHAILRRVPKPQPRPRRPRRCTWARSATT